MNRSAAIDIYCRYVVGWMIANRKSSEPARILLKLDHYEQHVEPTKLTIHADHGSTMTSKPVEFLVADLERPRAIRARTFQTIPSGEKRARSSRNSIEQLLK